MDDRRFDRWALALGERLDRRGMARLAASALSALGIGAAFDDASGKKKKKRKKKKKKKYSASPPPPPKSPPGSPPGTPPGSPPPPPTLWPRTYQGVGELKVQLVNISGQSLGVQTYQTNIRIEVRAPHARETNPFRLTFWSAPLVNNPGEISFHSGYVYDGVFFQFWTYAFDPNASSDFGGRLTDNHAAEALALNAMTIPKEIYPGYVTPYPVSIANGAEMLGRFGGDKLAIAMVGNSSYGVNPFQFTVLATQVA